MNYINFCLDYHNKMYDRYKYNFQRSWPNENVVRFVKKYIKKKNNRILDIGCGTGRNVIFFLKEKHHVFGVDFSSSALNLLKKKIKNKNLKVLQDSIPYLQKINTKHDAAIDCFTSYCLKKKDFEKYLINIKKKIKKNGLFHIQTLSKSCDIFKNYKPSKKIGSNSIDSIKRITAPFYGDKYLFSFYTSKELKLILKKYKFEILEFEKHSRTYRSEKEYFEYFVITCRNK